MARLPILAAALLLTAATAAHANDFYVDAVNGSNRNSGESWADAWQTVTHAVSLAQGTPTIHIAPGLYDAALGESFPIQLRSSNSFVGEQGSDVTILDGGGATGVFRTNSWPNITFEGLWLRNAERCIGDRLNNSDVHIKDSVISDADIGIDLPTHNDVPWLMSFRGTISLERVRIFNCGTGVRARCTSDYDPDAEDSQLDVNVIDSEISSCGTGLVVAAGPLSVSTLVMERCRVVDSVVGIRAHAYSLYFGIGQVTCNVEDSLIARNVNGCTLAAIEGSISSRMDLQRSTIVSNTEGGAQSDGRLFALWNCIVYGNGDDIYGTGLLASHCNIGDGDFEGANGNISADPLFVDAGGPDYRLTFGSPCIDVGEPHGPEKPDLNGIVRPVDGDLDAHERADMGAFEHAPLFVRGAASIGGALELEIWGPGGGSATIFWAAALGTPVDTPFGQFDLERHSARVMAVTATAPGPPVLFWRRIPWNPALIGTLHHLQARSTSPSGMIPAAFTNAVTFVIEP